MDFADAMKLVLGGGVVKRTLWGSKSNVRMHAAVIVEENGLGVGPYTPSQMDMIANDWAPVSRVPTDQLVLAGLDDQVKYGAE